MEENTSQEGKEQEMPETQQVNMEKLGKKQKELLEYLRQQGGSAWQEDIISHFSWSARYQFYLLGRLKKLEKRGLISIKTEINPETGRMKKRVYLIQ